MAGTATANHALTVLACQIDVPRDMRTVDDRSRHLDRIADLIEKALDKRPADLVLLPELSSVSYTRHCFSRPEIFAEADRGATFEILAPLAVRHGVCILYGAPRRRRNKSLAISQFAIDDAGHAAGRYDKLHMAQFGASMEKDYFTPGNQLLVLDVNGFKLAPVICYDMRFPDLARELALNHGVDAILHSVAFYRDESFYSWRSFVIARALENQIYWLSLNRAGDAFGGSIFCPPWVDEVSKETVLGQEETLRWLVLEKQVISAARKRYTFRTDRLPDYAGLAKLDGSR